jgi:hypothetical protein
MCRETSSDDAKDRYLVKSRQSRKGTVKSERQDET